MPAKDAHCSYCGHAFARDDGWPRACVSCSTTSYRNPTPVAVLLVPVDGGVLAVRRGIPPFVGQLALPGGFVNWGETWQQAAARELMEEALIAIDPADIRTFDVHSTPQGNHVLIFGVAPPMRSADLPPFASTEEATERLILTAPAELAFPLHTLVLRDYFGRAHAFDS